jgi:hypothetical protein
VIRHDLILSFELLEIFFQIQSGFPLAVKFFFSTKSLTRCCIVKDWFDGNVRDFLVCDLHS